MREVENNRIGERPRHVDDVLANVEQQRTRLSRSRALPAEGDISGLDFQSSAPSNGRVHHFLVAHAGKLDVLWSRQRIRNQAPRTSRPSRVLPISCRAVIDDIRTWSEARSRKLQN